MKRVYAVITYCFLNNLLCFASFPAEKELTIMYEQECKGSSDICEHVSVLRDLAKECESVVELGLRSMCSSWGILKGLSENTGKSRLYLGIDLANPSVEIFNKFKYISEAVGVKFAFIKANDMTVDLKAAVDMLFIDTLHTYCHLTYELEKFSPRTQKYIAMHDTSEPYGEMDESVVNYSLYPASYSKIKHGLWAAVVDFLANHPEWQLQERRLNCHGLTVLKRIA